MVGRQLIKRLAVHLLCQADTPRTKQLLASVRVVLVPTLNPDGYADALANHDDNARCSSVNMDSTILGRENAKGVDLDRNFPRDGVSLQDALQPETKALLGWLDGQPGVSLAANLVGGNLAAIYPWDLNPAGLDAPAPPPDASLLKAIALDFADQSADIGAKDVSLCLARGRRPSVSSSSSSSDRFPPSILFSAATVPQ